MTVLGRKNRLGKLCVYAVATMLAALWLTPMIWMILVSIKPTGSSVTVLGKLFSGPFTLDNYAKVLESSIWQWSLNSLIVCGATLLRHAGARLDGGVRAFVFAVQGQKVAILVHPRGHDGAA